MRSFDPVLADRLLAVLLILILAAETAAYADSDAGRVVGAAGLAVGICALAVRRSRPLLPLGLILAADLAIAALEPGFLNTTAVPFLALMVAIYSVARHVRGQRAMWICAAAIVLTALTSLVADDVDRPSQYVWLLVLGGAPAVVGRTLRNRRRLQDELRARAWDVEREGELRASRAVEDERVRIAGELQAVVANGVSAMVVQAEAVPRRHCRRRDRARRRFASADRGDGPGRARGDAPSARRAASRRGRRASSRRSQRWGKFKAWSSGPASWGWRLQSSSRGERTELPLRNRPRRLPRARGDA